MPFLNVTQRLVDWTLMALGRSKTSRLTQYGLVLCVRFLSRRAKVRKLHARAAYATAGVSTFTCISAICKSISIRLQVQVQAPFLPQRPKRTSGTDSERSATVVRRRWLQEAKSVWLQAVWHVASKVRFQFLFRVSCSWTRNVPKFALFWPSLASLACSSADRFLLQTLLPPKQPLIYRSRLLNLPSLKN